MINYNLKEARIVLNIEANNSITFPVELAIRLKIEVLIIFAAKSFRCSTCMQLVEIGILIIGLCKAGN